jgi:hypothetical protein
MIQMYFRAPATRKRCSVLGEEELPWLASVGRDRSELVSGESEKNQVASSSNRKHRNSENGKASGLLEADSERYR